MKHPKLLFGFFVVLGIIFLMLAIVGNYLNACDAVSILAPFHSQLGLLLGGMVLATVGIVGTGRHYFKNHRKRFTAFAAVLVPLAVFCVFFVAAWNMIFYAPMFPMRSEVTQVTVVDNSPLILSLNVKAITSRDTRIDGAIVLNSNDDIVAEIFKREYIVSKNWQGLAMAVLPAGSEITLTLDFNATLPSGNYLVRLTCWGDNHGDSSFTIP
jgi:hypothetical protein